MLFKFIQLCLVFILVGGGILIYNQPALRENIFSFLPKSSPLPDVKGIGTEKAGEVTGRLKSDIDEGVKKAQNEALNLKVSDLMSIVSRGQKIAEDFRGFQEYIKGQFDGVLNNK